MSDDGKQYDADYFLRGKQTGKSLYEDYRWLPELTVPMVASIVSHCGIRPTDTVLDFGCARGYVVRAFREMGYNAYGYDISEWALDNADPSVYHHLTRFPERVFEVQYDWVVTKDVLEHVKTAASTVWRLQDAARVGVFAVVPLSLNNGVPYEVPEYEHDVTHIHRLTLATWVGFFLRPGWRVEAAYRVAGVKDSYARYERGNGFITAKRSAPACG